MAADFNWAVGGEAGDGIDSTGKIFAQALSGGSTRVHVEGLRLADPRRLHRLQGANLRRQGTERR